MTQQFYDKLCEIQERFTKQINEATSPEEREILISQAILAGAGLVIGHFRDWNNHHAEKETPQEETKSPQTRP